jgi:uncharacterized protein (DUF362 family)
MLGQFHRAYVYHDRTLTSYDAEAPFSPSVAYPEYRYDDAGRCGSNRVYEAVRDLFHLMGLDLNHYGTAAWNPMRELVSPGDRVLLKPNFVLDFHGTGGPLESVITQAAVIRPVLDYVLLALEGNGYVVIGDAPLQSADFERIGKLSGLDDVLDFYRGRSGVSIEKVDFRRERACIDSTKYILKKEELPGDRKGNTIIRLDDGSMFFDVRHRYRRFRVTNYDPALMPLHHNEKVNEYLISGSVLWADVVISLPKMKTHRKAGLTAALKNSIGINAHKDWLPHHRRGSRAKGGDEYLYPNLLKAVADVIVEREDVERHLASKKLLGYCRGAFSMAARLTSRDKFFEGSWYGNDTLWRTILDLNRILLYAGKDGVMQEQIQRRLFFLVDGIVAGEGEGPLEPTPKPCGLLVGGSAAPTVDAAIARLMGFDVRKIPSIREAFRLRKYPLATFGPEQVEISSNSSELRGLKLFEPGSGFQFVPPKGWQGNIELIASESDVPAYPKTTENISITYRGLRLP